MSDDALFQLGMDLDRGSSTAQTEEKLSQRRSSREEERKDFFCERDGVRYAGTHLIIDLVRAERLDDLEHIEATLRRCVEVAGATLLHIHLHHFTPNGGVSGVAVLAESHISVHTWPESGFAAFDVFMCGDADPHKAVDVLKRTPALGDQKAMVAAIKATNLQTIVGPVKWNQENVPPFARANVTRTPLCYHARFCASKVGLRQPAPARSATMRRGAPARAPPVL